MSLHKIELKMGDKITFFLQHRLTCAKNTNSHFSFALFHRKKGYFAWKMADVIILRFMYSKQRRRSEKKVKMWHLREQRGNNKRLITIYTQQYFDGKRKWVCERDEKTKEKKKTWIVSTLLFLILNFKSLIYCHGKEKPSEEWRISQKKKKTSERRCWQIFSKKSTCVCNLIWLSKGHQIHRFRDLQIVKSFRNVIIGNKRWKRNGEEGTIPQRIGNVCKFHLPCRKLAPCVFIALSIDFLRRDSNCGKVNSLRCWNIEKNFAQKNEIMEIALLFFGTFFQGKRLPLIKLCFVYSDIESKESTQCCEIEQKFFFLLESITSVRMGKFYVESVYARDRAGANGDV